MLVRQNETPQCATVRMMKGLVPLSQPSNLLAGALFCVILCAIFVICSGGTWQGNLRTACAPLVAVCTLSIMWTACPVVYISLGAIDLDASLN